MKNKVLFTSVLFVISVAIVSAQKVADSKIRSVTVFYQGAQVERSVAEVSLPVGQSVIVVNGLERSLVENSLRVGLKGSAKILNVVKSIDYLNEKENSEKIIGLKSKLEDLQEQIEDGRMKVSVYEEEKNFLVANMNLGGSNTGVTVAQIKEGADYYRARLMEIERTILETNRSLLKKGEQSKKIKAQLSQLNYQKSKPTTKIEVTVELEKAGSCGLLLDYIVQGASWVPSYDIRIDEVGDDVQMVRKATVRQSTGENWKGVVLTFSTGNPMEQQSIPILNPWIVDFMYQPAPVMIRGVASKSARAVQSQPAAYEIAEVAVEDEEYDMTDVSVSFEAGSKNSIQEFTLKAKADISTDGKEYVFSLGTETLAADYHYQTVPKKDEVAYLVATILDWEGYELLDGNANIYYEKMFVGETWLGTSMTLDSMSLSMGKDKGIIVDRKVVKDYTRTRTLGANVKKSFGYELVVRNTKSSDIELLLEDQVPISSNSQITIDTDELSGGVMNEGNGKVTWRMTVPSGETKSVLLKYSIKYPKDQQINF